MTQFVKHSRVSANQMHLKVTFLEVICTKIPVRAHKPWFIYTGVSKYKSESVHKHWSFHTYMQANQTHFQNVTSARICTATADHPEDTLNKA